MDNDMWFGQTFCSFLGGVWLMNELQCFWNAESNGIFRPTWELVRMEATPCLEDGFWKRGDVSIENGQPVPVAF